VFQVTGISLLFIAKMSGSVLAFDTGIVALIASVGFAVVSLITYGL